MASKKARGKRANTRYKIAAPKTKASINKHLQTFESGETVQIVINGSIHAGIPFRRFHGLTGNVVGMQGRAVKVRVMQGNQPCIVIVGAVHVKPIQQEAKAAVIKGIGA